MKFKVTIEYWHDISDDGYDTIEREVEASDEKEAEDKVRADLYNKNGISSKQIGEVEVNEAQ